MPNPEPLPGPFAYRLFGLSIASDIELPELRHANGDVDHDVVIRTGRVPKEGRGVITVPDIARFQVAGPGLLLVEANPEAAARNVRLYLLGSAMGLLLHRRGLLPLHASAIDIDGRAVAFMGPSGAGKSTLATWFHDRGFPLLADDVVVVGFQQGAAVAFPGMPRVRLWGEALQQSGRSTSGFQRSYAGDDDWDKYDVPLASLAGNAGPIALAVAYDLGFGPATVIEPLRGLPMAEAVFAHTYRGHFIAEEGDPAVHWRSALKLVEQVPVFRFERLRGFDHLDQALEHALAHARDCISRD